MKELTHASIAKFIDYYYTSDRDLCFLHIVNEALPSSVYQLIRQRALSRPHLSLYLYQVLSALDHLQKLNIMHRNVGTHSVFIDTRTHRLYLGEF